MRAIVKVQLPIATTDPHPMALVYAKNKRYLAQQPLDQATLLAMGNDVKAFFEGEFLADRMLWSIGKRVDNQGW